MQKVVGSSPIIRFRSRLWGTPGASRMAGTDEPSPEGDDGAAAQRLPVVVLPGNGS
jgi:hypothetical protein